MPSLYERSLIKFGSDEGLVVVIPKAWARYHDLKAGDKVEVVAGRDLKIRPIVKSSQEKGG